MSDTKISEETAAAMREGFAEMHAEAKLTEGDLRERMAKAGEMREVDAAIDRLSKMAEAGTLSVEASLAMADLAGALMVDSHSLRVAASAFFKEDFSR